MDIKLAYNQWASQYDKNDNKTRDLEKIAMRTILSDIDFKACIELGCGTGKNTEWLAQKAKNVTAVDFSEEMISIAKKKIASSNITFVQADINQAWDFAWKDYDIAIFSLVLEHVEYLETIFQKASECIQKNGYIYIGELHPYKQYNGSKARFDTANGQNILQCYNHNISEFTQCAKIHGFELIYLNEFFDDNDEQKIPRILSMLFKKHKHIM